MKKCNSNFRTNVVRHFAKVSRELPLLEKVLIKIQSVERTILHQTDLLPNTSMWLRGKKSKELDLGEVVKLGSNRKDKMNPI